jgi:phosphodiesterase/alkaline phosphatase D-like protein
MKNDVTRRGVLAAASATSLAACSTKPKIRSFSADTEHRTGTFAHGVASGDPLATSVILWTRITPSNPNAGSVPVTWEMDQDPDFKTLSASGEASANQAGNWTAKIDVQDLDPDTWYFYRFIVNGDVSEVGQTRTLPDGQVPQARFAIVSCSNWQQGYFNPYDHIARQDHFDALLHLGDYIYEYGTENIAGTKHSIMGRLHEPRHEIITLDDYRQRHAQYRSDPSLQAVTAKMPMIAIWDDHETSNDSWKTGAENHNEGEGSWDDRRAAALRAYYEWMPVRDPVPGKARESLFRAFEWGDLLTLTALESRLLARDESLVVDDYFDLIATDGGAEKFKKEILGAAGRNMLGDAQLDFIADTLKASMDAGKPWRVMANQVPMVKLKSPDLTPHVTEEAISAIETQWSGIRPFVEFSKFGLPVYPDAWDGYPAAREKLYSRLNEIDVTDMLVITGDAHEFWINDLVNDDDKKMGIEIGTSSVSSETLKAFLGPDTADYALLMTQTNQDVRYYNPQYQGYVDLEFTKRKATARLIAVDTVSTPDYGAFEVAKFTVRPTKSTLKFTSPKGLNLKQRVLFSGLG